MVWIINGFVQGLFIHSHTHMHFHDINSILEFCPFRRKCWLRSREIVISVMASQTFPEFMVLITSWGNNLRTIIRKCSHSNRTLSVACNGLGSGCLTSPLGMTVRSDSRISQPKRSRNHAYSEPIHSAIGRVSRVLTHYDIPKDRTQEEIFLTFATFHS